VPYQEDNTIIPASLQQLLQLFLENRVQVLIHPLSFNYMENNEKRGRGEVILSRFNSWTELKSPPNPDEDYPFRVIIKWTGNVNDIIDDNLLYSVYRDAADFLITNRNGIHDKAAEIDIADRVMYLDEALKYFSKQFPRITFKASASVLKRVPLRDLDLSATSLSELGEDYDEFAKWFDSGAVKGLEAWVYMDDKSPAALLTMEQEELPVDARLDLNQKRRLKISILCAPEVVLLNCLLNWLLNFRLLIKLIRYI
jgi:hypothetical protein